MPTLPNDIDVTKIPGYHTTDPVAEAQSPKGQLEEFKGQQIVSGRTPAEVQEDVKGFVGRLTQRGDTPTAPGSREIMKLQSAGFTDEEVGAWSMQQRKQLSEAGFGQGEIDTYFGQPPFDPAPVKAHINETIKAAIAPTTEGGQPKPVTDFKEAFIAGFGESSLALLTQGKPTTTVAPDAATSSRIAGQIGSMLGEVPAFGAGYLLGGGPRNPIMGMAGGFAVPALIRKVYMDKVEKGEVTGFKDFWERFSGAFIEAADGWITGAAAATVGKAIGLAPIVSPTAKAAAKWAGEIATMVTVGDALKGHLPEPQEFFDTAIALGVFKGTSRVAGKLQNIYRETGVKPDDVAADVMKDPTILHDLMSENVEVPKAYQPGAEPSVTDIHAKADEKGIVWDDSPAFMDFTEKITGKRHLDDLTPAERTEMANALEEWTPNMAMGGGAPNKPVGEAQQKVLDRLMLKDPKTERMTLSDIYTSVVDNLNPIKQALKAGDKVDLPTAVNPYSLERLTRGIAGKASEFLNAGAFDFSTYKTTTEGYFKILEPVKKDLDGFRAYLAAKGGISRAERGIASGIPLEEAKTVVREGKVTYEPILKARTKYRDALLDTLQQSGILSAKSVEAMKEADKDHVPFYRFFEDEQGRPISGKQVRNPIKRMKGGEQRILDPIISDIKDTFLFVGLAEKNAARQAFVKLGPEFAVKQKQPIQATHLTETEIRKVFDEFVTLRKETAKIKTETSTGGVAKGMTFDDLSESAKNAIYGFELTQKTNYRKDVHLVDAEWEQTSVSIDSLRKGNETLWPGGAFIHRGSMTSGPIILDRSGQVIDGNNRLYEAMQRGDATIEILRPKTAQAGSSKRTEIVVAKVKEAMMARGYYAGEADQYIRRVGEAEAGKIGATTEKIIKEIETTTYVPELDIRLPNEAATVFRAMQAPAQNDEVAVYTNGHRDLYKVDPKVAEAFNGLDEGPTSLLAKIAYAPASLLRAGVTITPDFAIRNLMRDAISAFIYAGSNPVKTLLGLKSIVTQDDAFHKMMKGGGFNATLVSVDQNYLGQHLGQLNAETGLMRRAWNVAKTPLDILRATSELAENSTRLGAVRSKLLQTQDKARIQALSLIAREATVDFARHGRDTQGYARSTAFFNPAIQGIDRFAREMKENPLGMTAKAVASITLPSMLLWYANKDDKEIQNLPRWFKDLFWVTRVPLPGGKSFLFPIPKPQELGIIFGTIPERLLDEFVAHKPDAMRDIEKTLEQAFTPSLIPTGPIAVIEQFSNRRTLTGNPLIPAGLQGLLPEYQYTPYTTETAKAMGQLIGAFPGMEKAALGDDPFIGGVARALTTPILLENYLRSWTGGMGMYLLQLADKGLREAGVVPDPVTATSTLSDIPFVRAFTVRYPSASAQSIQDFRNDFAVSKKYYDTIMYLAKSPDASERLKAESLMKAHKEDMAQLGEIDSAISDQTRIIQMINKNPKITPDEKRQLIDTLCFRMIELSQAGNAGLRKLKDVHK